MHILTTILAQASDNQEAAALGALLALIAGFGMILVAGIVVVTLIGMWKVFTKAGEPGWAVLIPIYNLIVLLHYLRISHYLIFFGIGNYVHSR